MANSKQAGAKRLNMKERAEQQRLIQFPDVPPELLWHRLQNDGYSSIPRTLPIAMQIVDSRSKGQPAGHTLFCLWARAPDDPLVVIENPMTFAAEAGFEGSRAADTWRRRMQVLVDLDFIRAKQGTWGKYSYVLLLNPNSAIQRMREAGKVQDALYGRFVDRISDIGALSDIQPPAATPQVATPPAITL